MHHSERGTSMVEALMATVVAVVAALATIFALVSGSAGIRSMRIERGAFFVAQQQLETLLSKPSSDASLTLGNHGPQTATLPYVNGQTTWNLSWVDDPLDGTGGGDTDPHDYKMLQVTVTWTDVRSRTVALNTYLYP